METQNTKASPYVAEYIRNVLVIEQPPVVRMCWRCGAERFQTRIVNGYADRPGQPRYLSVCQRGHGCCATHGGVE